MSAFLVAPANALLRPPQFPSCSSARADVVASPVIPQTEEQRWRQLLVPLLAGCRDIPRLKQIHALVLRSSTTCIPSAASSARDFIFLYSRILHVAASDAADLHYATRVLNHLLLLDDSGAVHLPTASSFFWNTLIRAHARSSHHQHAAVDLYRRMLLDGRVPPDKYTFPFVLRACAYLFALPEGEQVHGHAVKLGLAPDVYVANSLVHFYATCGRLELACRIFDGMSNRSLVSWNVIIDGFVAGGRYEDALDLFREMQREFTPDTFSMQSLIGACEGLGALSLGMWAHAFMLRRCGGDVPGDVLVNNSLLDMYAKCGSLVLARQMFDRMPSRDVASWNAMILGFAMHGLAKESIQTFASMQEEDGVKPNEITFIGILSACNHGGLVSEGRTHFTSMASVYGVGPRIEHYGCMVDLLARAGLVDEALDLVSTMPCKPDAVIWRSLLDACWKSKPGVFEMEEEESSTSGAFVLLSRIYASANRWNEVGLVRKLMSEQGIRKVPGCSSIEVGGAVHEFLAGDTRHPQSEKIYAMLRVMEERVGLVGYAADLSQAPMVAEHDDERRRSLRLHSERLAIAASIRIFKNLRVCRDCHEMTKLVTLAFGVEIIVRDRTRFHHFKDGLCSCADYW
ncbi:unnamed protein product [Spirodela intermedia]|uniref:DYW domain-containing protein n=1 Tax=Spirodela intermedia TaxID=51605 RepID=A0A7I8IMM8_SPIIN|nr:unnamed protein product [Spirodela intermedia]CAA6659020.1 unnamed protein product [Spirodela intermedia]